MTKTNTPTAAQGATHATKQPSAARGILVGSRRPPVVRLRPGGGVHFAPIAIALRKG